MKKERKDKDFVKAAYFEGGRAGIEAYVKKELRYPKEALEAKVEGTVSVRYTVDYKGKVIDASIIAGLGHGCDEEALRIVRSMQFRVPNDGKIKSKYSNKLHIHFRLPGSPAKLPSTKKMEGSENFTQINYHVTTTPSKPSGPAPKKSSSSYQIQINWQNEEQEK
ncbi:MAG TPA: energy transducer TonB [Saprospiraceae bacterium]|nr:energy transducer TonB [Saprospiraceae bacterium]